MLPEVSSKKKVFCGSIEELDKIVEEILDFAQDRRLWLLEGQLGSGKTTLVKSVCQSKDVIDTVTSPTFSIVNEYQTDLGETLYHFDFFRIKDLQEAVALGLEDYLDSGQLCLIEWPSLVQGILPEKNLQIEIEVGPDDSRTFHLTRNG